MIVATQNQIGKTYFLDEFLNDLFSSLKQNLGYLLIKNKISVFQENSVINKQSSRLSHALDTLIRLRGNTGN